MSSVDAVKKKVIPLLGHEIWKEEYWTDFIQDVAQTLCDAEISLDLVSPTIVALIQDRVLQKATVEGYSKEEFFDLFQMLGVPKAHSFRIYRTLIAPSFVPPAAQPPTADVAPPNLIEQLGRLLLDSEAKMQATVAQELEDRLGEKRVQFSKSAKGGEVYDFLLQQGDVKQFKPKDGKRRILSAMEQDTLSKCQSEHAVVEFLTEHLERALSTTDWVLVNSEEYKWLQVGTNRANDLKPDVFFCHKALYEKKPLPKFAQMNDTRRFGIINWMNRDCIGLVLEAKLELNGGDFDSPSNEALGEITEYMSNISTGVGGPRSGRALLFDKTQFWMIKTDRGYPSMIEKVRWTHEGSFDALAGFACTSFPWIALLGLACNEWNLVAEEHGFLGCGVDGRVFQVHEIACPTTQRALKLDLGDAGTRMCAEHNHMKKAHQACPEHVVEPMGWRAFKFDVNSFTHKGAAMVLSQVGSPPFPKLHQAGFRAVRQIVKDIVLSLFALHVKEIVHGDARLANVVKVGGVYKWIDFRSSTSFPGTPQGIMFQGDMTLLVQSILKANVLPDELNSSIASYTGTERSHVEEIMLSLNRVLIAEEKRKHEMNKTRLVRQTRDADEFNSRLAEERANQGTVSEDDGEEA